MTHHEVEAAQSDAPEVGAVPVEDHTSDENPVVDSHSDAEVLPEITDESTIAEVDPTETVVADADADADASVGEGEDDDQGDEGDDDDDETDVAPGDAVGAAEDAASGTGSGPAPRRSGKARLAQLEREGEVAADFLERLLDIADLDGDIDVDVDGDRAAVAIVDSEEGQVPRRLVGPEGRVLDALQDLTRLAVQTATGERSRLMLDVAGFRAARRAALVEIAKAVIERVRETGTPQPLEPMTAFERKVVHDEVAGAGLVSESEGAEPRRYVVIQPA